MTADEQRNWVWENRWQMTKVEREAVVHRALDLLDLKAVAGQQVGTFMGLNPDERKYFPGCSFPESLGGGVRSNFRHRQAIVHCSRARGESAGALSRRADQRSRYAGCNRIERV
jgi:hypothetical protein